MPTPNGNTAIRAREQTEKNLARWRDEVARRKARKIRGEAAALVAPVILPPRIVIRERLRQ